MKTFNSKRLKARRQRLQNNATPHEIKLWARLQNDQLGCRFRRQYSIRNYVVDFYCPKKQLIVETDGSQHFEDKTVSYDEKRTAFLEELGCTVLRFSNAEVNSNMQGVLLKIMGILETRF